MTTLSANNQALLAKRSPKSRKSLGRLEHDKENQSVAARARKESSRSTMSEMDLSRLVKAHLDAEGRKRSKSLGGDEKVKAPLSATKATKHTIVASPKLSPRRAARRSLVPGRSILKALSTSNLQDDNDATSDLGVIFTRRVVETVSTRNTLDQDLTFPATMPATWTTEDDQTGNFTTSFDSRIATATGDEPRSRKSIGRRVSFAATAHVRLFEREQDLTPDRMSINASAPDSASSRGTASPATPKTVVRVVEKVSMAAFTPNLSPRQAARLLQNTPSQAPSTLTGQSFFDDAISDDDDDEFVTDDENENILEQADSRSDDDETDLGDVQMGKQKHIDPRARAFLEGSPDDSSDDNTGDMTRPNPYMIPQANTHEIGEEDTEEGGIQGVLLGAARLQDQPSDNAADETRLISQALQSNTSVPRSVLQKVSVDDGNQDEESTQEITMEVTQPFGTSLQPHAESALDDKGGLASDEDDEEATMDITTAIGTIMDDDLSQRRAPDAEFLGLDDDEDEEEEQTMDITQAIGTILEARATQESDTEDGAMSSDGEDDMTMEITQAIGQIHADAPEHSKRKSIGLRKSLGSPARVLLENEANFKGSEAANSTVTANGKHNPQNRHVQFSQAANPSLENLSTAVDEDTNQDPSIESAQIQHITLRQFLDYTGVSFMDGLTSTRRKSIMTSTMLNYGIDSFDLTEQIRRRSSLGSGSINERTATFGEYIVASAINMPLLELYQFCCKELRGYIAEGKEVVDTIEAESDLENPLIFHEWMLADDASREVMETQFKMIKTYSRLQAKETWYAWRIKLFSPVQEVYDRNLEHFQKDQKKVTQYTETIDPLLARLEARSALLKKELENAHGRRAIMKQCDHAQLVELNNAVQEQNMQIGLLTADLKEQDLDAQYAKTKLRETREQRNLLVQEIERAEALTEDLKSFTRSEIFKLNGKFEDLCQTFGWHVISLGPSRIEMVLQDSLGLKIDLQHSASANRIALHWNKPDPARTDAALCEGLVRGLTRQLNEVRAISHHSIVHKTSLFWQEIAQLRDEIRMLRLKAPSVSSINGEAKMVSVKTTLFMAAIKAKLIIDFQVPIDYNVMPMVNYSAMSSQVDMVYGEESVNIDDVRATLRQSVRLLRTRDILSNACSDVIALYE